MPSIFDALTDEQKLDLAARVQPPTRLADLFAAFVGQFPDGERARFDALARQARDCYALTDPNHARCFRSRLNQRLHDRFHTPVAWEVGRHG